MKLTGWKTVIVASVGILTIGGLESLALSKGIDGTVLAGVIAVIGAIIGGTLGFKIGKSKQ